MPGAAYDVAVSAENDLWVIGTCQRGGGHGIYHWDSAAEGWTRVDGGAVRIAVGPTGVWVVNNEGNVYQRVDNHWKCHV